MQVAYKRLAYMPLGKCLKVNAALCDSPSSYTCINKFRSCADSVFSRRVAFYPGGTHPDPGPPRRDPKLAGG